MEAAFEKAKLSFSAIGVLAAIDLEGKQVVCMVKDGSIGVPELIEMSKRLKSVYRRKVINLFLDNLAIHYNRAFQEACRKNGQRLIFNAAYSSPLNPIERLWSLAKRNFGRFVVGNSNLKS